MLGLGVGEGARAGKGLSGSIRNTALWGTIRVGDVQQIDTLQISFRNYCWGDFTIKSGVSATEHDRVI